MRHDRQMPSKLGLSGFAASILHRRDGRHRATVTPQERLQRSADEINRFLQEDEEGAKSPGVPATQHETQATPTAPGAGDGMSGPPQLNSQYGARAPRSCAPLNQTPNAAQAAALVQCGAERQDWLLQGVRVQLAPPHRFTPGMDPYYETCARVGLIRRGAI